MKMVAARADFRNTGIGAQTKMWIEKPTLDNYRAIFAMQDRFDILHFLNVATSALLLQAQRSHPPLFDSDPAFVARENTMVLSSTSACSTALYVIGNRSCQSSGIEEPLRRHCQSNGRSSAYGTACPNPSGC